MDPVHFSAEEILDMAIRIEANGERFYTDAAAMSKNKEIKELFTFLSIEESKHTAYFTKLRELVTEDNPKGGFDPYIEEAGRYIQALSDSKVFTGPPEGTDIAAIYADEKLALDYAINAEKESLLLYYEMLKAVRGKDEEMLGEIIAEEKDHLLKLTELKKTISKGV
jgi:rubrerythrin